MSTRVRTVRRTYARRVKSARHGTREEPLDPRQAAVIRLQRQAGNRAVTRAIQASRVVQRDAVPTKAQWWKHFGYEMRRGEYQIEPLGNTKAGTPMHLTVSFDSIYTPTAKTLTQSTNAIKNYMFAGPPLLNQVHVTLESEPKKHLYWVGISGLGRRVRMNWWGGQAKEMNDAFATFEKEVGTKIDDAKAEDWDIGT